MLGRLIGGMGWNNSGDGTTPPRTNLLDPLFHAENVARPLFVIPATQATDIALTQVTLTQTQVTQDPYELTQLTQQAHSMVTQLTQAAADPDTEDSDPPTSGDEQDEPEVEEHDPADVVEMVVEIDRHRVSYPRTACFQMLIRAIMKKEIDLDKKEMQKALVLFKKCLAEAIASGSTRCNGCESVVCVRDWNASTLMSMPEEDLKVFLQAHKIVGDSCAHSHKDAGTVYVRCLGGKCPVAGCRVSGSPFAPILNKQYCVDTPSKKKRQRKAERKKRRKAGKKKKEEEEEEKDEEEETEEEETEEDGSDVDSGDEGSESWLRRKLLYFLYFSSGISYSAMRETLGLKITANTATKWRNELERGLAAAHYIDTANAAGTVRFCQADEVVFGKRKYNRGSETNQNGQMWFQTLVSLDAEGNVLAFYARYVPNRTAATLQDWIVDLVADGAEIATDSFTSYFGLADAAFRKGKTVTTRMVNHSVTYKATDGTHTNGVEGMHCHVKIFIRKAGNLGSERVKRIWRVIAAAHLSNPAVSAAVNGSVSRFQRLLLGLKTVSTHGVPFLVVSNDGATNKKLPKYTVAEYDPKDEEFVNSTTKQRFTFEQVKHGVEEARTNLVAYQDRAEAERVAKKPRAEDSSMQETLKAKERENKKQEKAMARLHKEEEKLKKQTLALEKKQADLKAKKAKHAKKAAAVLAATPDGATEARAPVVRRKRLGAE